MATFKVVISEKAKKTEAKEVKDAEAAIFVGKKIGESVDASSVGLGKVMITGGSDRAGFPMRADIMGGGKKYVLLTKGVGLKRAEEGMKKRKLVRGNTITEEIYQVNVKKLE